MTGDWFILRCAGRSTLPLASSLAEDGFEAYAPIETIRIEIPKLNVRRFGKKALLPEFVFVRRQHLIDLLEAERKPRRRMLKFHLLRTGERIAFANDAELDWLREMEARSARKMPRQKSKPLPRNARVRVGSGSPYTGMHGTVRRSNGGITILCFGGWMDKVEIETSLLTLDEAYSGEAANRKAA